MKFKAFQFTIIFLIMGIISIFAPSTVLADAHETEGEMAPEAEAMEEKPGVSGWFQIDIDSLGSYFLIGASHPVGGLSIASNIYVNEKHDYNFEDGSHSHRYLGEFDLGVTVPVVSSDSLSLALQPMVGIGFDYTGADGPHALYPQVFAFLNANDFFLFHWTISTIYSIFEEDSIDELYNRTYLTYALNDTIAIGPQVESVLGLGEKGELWAFNFGARLNIGYGTANTLGIYVGYETKKGDDETGLTGRMNFTRFW